MNTTMLKTKDVLTLLGISRSSLYVGVRNGTYPKPLRLGPKGRDCYWPKEVIQAVIEKAAQPQ
jgi:predicted DNA-binding transcriptional regulator AlpA